ncbi:L-ribulose-5-phosphate 4-epimerase AraD [Herbiconiux moechotypicola]|uniref:L-ribulose-5-phosphate 4-epimerase n=1 Tax=Herbiconiux moechotypicola TaxID=637393 RepID=A0ABN3DQ05_9MICO|nr:L-ribulose-5-phosphate 4-epimerase AraD [Herbiconiux moechotypicola]MCS5731674.1 L-ribulose-5-phosphate 4-epimerase AraD [Herbiconiux moechotypicola]
MLEELKKQVVEANRGLKDAALAILTWGNASGFDPESGLVVIKGSGVAYEDMGVDDLAVVDLDGNAVEGAATPSTDLATHLTLYRNFPSARGVIHTHSLYATAWAQLGRDIPCYGTTHADYFPGPIPCTRTLGSDEVSGDYELATGDAIVQRFADLDPAKMRAVLVRYHGPFVWGSSPADALHNAMVLEYVSQQAFNTSVLSGGADPTIDRDLMHKHYERKFGKDAYYGQSPAARVR